ncbi:MAG: hypothetical protein C5S46_06350 [Candidatus Methanomarinus sp.]|uniref:Uncharacterized protein n=1 Tax=Candidatus Methanomarinus sp. TaxID=3386244 RepID=A0AC61S999_9EURY|nr:MAG: hypothetical protein C5S46_06350 [ANME-2 cluster archaeon]
MIYDAWYGANSTYWFVELLTLYSTRITEPNIVYIPTILYNPNHVQLFIQFPPKYSVSFIAKMLKARTSRILRKEFPKLKKWCKRCDYSAPQ